MNDGTGGMNESGHSHTHHLDNQDSLVRQIDGSWINSSQNNTPDLDQIDQFANAMYQQYELETVSNGNYKAPLSSTGPNTYESSILPNLSLNNPHPVTTSVTPSIPSQPQDHGFAAESDFDYFNYTSFSVPSSRIDHLYPTQPTFEPPATHYTGQNHEQIPSFPQPGSISNHYSIQNNYPKHHTQPQKPPQHPQPLLAQHLGPGQESHLKRKLSLNPQAAPLTPPLSKAKANKHLQKPQKPKTVRQNSFPIVTNSKVKKSFPIHYNLESTVSSSHDSSSLRQSYFEFDNISEYHKTHRIHRSMDGDGLGSQELASHDHELVSGEDSSDLPGSYSTNTTAYGPAPSKNASRPRGRPKKSKNPGFFIKLDNINRNGPVKLGATHSNSSVDSLFHAKNPNVNLVSSKQFSALPTFPDLDDDSSRSDLRILEPDLGNYDSGAELQRFASVNSNMTPSMKPPGTSQNSYFEVDNASNNFLSPHINYNEQNYNNFNEGFSEYLIDPKPADSRVDDGQRVEMFGQEVDSHPDLNGYNFDVNPNEIPPQYVKSDDPDRSNNFSEQEESSAKEPSLDPENFRERYIGLLPELASSPDMAPLERTTSVQSTASTASREGTDGGDKKKKKKRNTKGAICTICNKHISRDLTRHLRIHNEVGRFQCVYPKDMCNHKTQHFNRPYDYKKHLLHIHFKFDDPKGKLSHTLTDKLPLPGTCIACGNRFIAKDWLDSHVLTSDENTRCAHVV